MILIGNQRGGAKDLALHLLKDENEHVEVFEVRGFVSDDLIEAMDEAYAVSRGTKCSQFLFSLSLNPPETERIETPEYLTAIERIEKQFGLGDQPRAIVFHEKQGRRHAHVVWSRIDTNEMKAVQLSFTKNRLKEISRDLFIEHGWQMPRGLANSKERDPRNFTLAEWQQARRIGKDPRAIKAAFQDAWALSDSKAAFIHALAERGFHVARGERRGFVAVDYQGEVFAIAKWTDRKTKEIRQRLGDETDLPSLAAVNARIAEDMLGTVDRLAGELDTRAAKRKRGFEARRTALVERQRAARKKLKGNHDQRRTAEARERQARFRRGLKGIWDWLTGEKSKIAKQNEQDAASCETRDRAEVDALIFRQLEERWRLREITHDTLADLIRQRQELRDDRQTYEDMAREPEPPDQPRRRRTRGFER